MIRKYQQKHHTKIDFYATTIHGYSLDRELFILEPWVNYDEILEMLEPGNKSAQVTMLKLTSLSISVGRIPSLDLIKWLAFVTMFIDHLRFIAPQLSWCYYPGRISFPCFCFVIASHMQRKLDGRLPTKNITCYLYRIIVFFFISEYPYRLFITNAKSCNILLTLSISVLFVWLAINNSRLIQALCIPVVLIVELLGDRVMYGVPGVLLPFAILLTLRYGIKVVALPLAFAMMANINIQRVMDVGVISTGTLSSALLAGVGVAVAFVMYEKITMNPIPPINRWGYLLYPMHFFIYYVIRSFIR